MYFQFKRKRQRIMGLIQHQPSSSTVQNTQAICLQKRWAILSIHLSNLLRLFFTEIVKTLTGKALTLARFLMRRRAVEI